MEKGTTMYTSMKRRPTRGNETRDRTEKVVVTGQEHNWSIAKTKWREGSWEEISRSSPLVK